MVQPIGTGTQNSPEVSTPTQKPTPCSRISQMVFSRLQSSQNADSDFKHLKEVSAEICENVPLDKRASCMEDNMRAWVSFVTMH